MRQGALARFAAAVLQRPLDKRVAALGHSLSLPTWRQRSAESALKPLPTCGCESSNDVSQPVRLELIFRARSVWPSITSFAVPRIVCWLKPNLTSQRTKRTCICENRVWSVRNRRRFRTMRTFYQRVSASSSSSLAATQSAPSRVISFFQKGARDFRKSIRNSAA